jgi:hypothetical protein
MERKRNAGTPIPALLVPISFFAISPQRMTPSRTSAACFCCDAQHTSCLAIW